MARAKTQAAITPAPDYAQGQQWAPVGPAEIWSNAADIQSPTTAPPAPEGVRVMLLCRDVFLPENLLDADWDGSTTTRQYDGETPEGRRAKLTVHPTLAAFLQERKQAEILD